MMKVSKLNIVFDTFDVKPAVLRFVVVIAFDTYKFPVTWSVDVGAVFDIPIRLLVDTNRLAVDEATPELER